MIIIGLLIGGILKGQELIANARLAANVSKVKAVDAALNTFRDSYSGLPGDLINNVNVLPNCATTSKCGEVAGNGDGRIGVGPGAAQATATENLTAWAQLATTNLISGVTNSPSGTTAAAGVTNPVNELGGMITIGYAVGNATLPGITGTTATARAGQYLALKTTATTASSATVGLVLTPNQASRIDLKLDDGAPNSGSVLGAGAVAAVATPAIVGCADTNAAGSPYHTTWQGIGCSLYVLVQQ